MPKSIDKRKNYFYIDPEKLDKMMQRGFSDSRLSKAIGRDRTWLHEVRNRTPQKGAIRVELEDAQKMAYVLNCGIQSLGKRGQNTFRDPVIFDIQMAGLIRFGRLFAENPIEMTRFMEVLESKAFTINDLFLYVSQRGQLQHQGLKGTGEQWWKMLYLSSLTQEIARQLTCCNISSLQDQYISQKEIIQNHYKKVLKRATKEDEKEIIEKMEAEKRKKLVKIIQENIEREVDIKFDNRYLKQRAAETSAQFLLKVFEGRETDLSVNAQISLYKRGDLYAIPLLRKQRKRKAKKQNEN